MGRLIGFTLLAAALCCGQPDSDCKRASTNIPGAQFPCVYPDNRATFRLVAPDAQKVQVRLGQTFDMTRGDGGVWSVTLPPQVVGFHYYYLVIDGVQVNDPASEAFYGVNRESSGIEIPEKGVDYYEPKAVPHGEVRSRWYYSKVTGAWRRCFVYTPPDYDTNLKARYPVLYLLHGGGEDETGLAYSGTRELHPRQPDRGEEGQADADRHGQHGRAESRGTAPAGRGAPSGRGAAAGPPQQGAPRRPR